MDSVHTLNNGGTYGFRTLCLDWRTYLNWSERSRQRGIRRTSVDSDDMQLQVTSDWRPGSLGNRTWTAHWIADPVFTPTGHATRQAGRNFVSAGHCLEPLPDSAPRRAAASTRNGPVHSEPAGPRRFAFSFALDSEWAGLAGNGMRFPYEPTRCLFAAQLSSMDKFGGCGGQSPGCAPREAGIRGSESMWKGVTIKVSVRAERKGSLFPLW